MNLQSKFIYAFAGVLTLSLAGCSSDEVKISATPNESAALIGNLSSNPLQWKVITSAVNTQESTMSTLYGNDVAVNYARTNAQGNYPVGSILSLVTWTRQEDARWFGGRIPEKVKSVEFVTVGLGSYSYENYQGTPLKRVSGQQGSSPTDRSAYLLSQRAAVMP